MAYEKVKLCYAMVSGEVYLSSVKENGVMGSNRRIITDEVLIATIDYMIGNKKTWVGFEEQEDGTNPALFYTGDKEKAAKIRAILEG
ncbi:DUF7446 family protein [Listeria booriae]|uniref:Uncharacterized protein n=1 Tax=Listeria booriae TaxID=1552123 RepID=A0A842ET49_9LIST|nr:hypothetical protein [Listeria booriae]MBC2242270.1 hypothetical protein [Listeria booriae]